MVQEQSPEAETPQATAQEERFVRKGGQERTVFRLTVAMSRLEAAFNYEADDALPLGGISIEASTLYNASWRLARCLVVARATRSWPLCCSTHFAWHVAD